MIHKSHQRAFKSRRSLAGLFIVLPLLVSLPAQPHAATATADNEARWKNGDLVAPLPSDLETRARALEEVRRKARARTAAH